MHLALYGNVLNFKQDISHASGRELLVASGHSAHLSSSVLVSLSIHLMFFLMFFYYSPVRSMPSPRPSVPRLDN